MSVTDQVERQGCEHCGEDHDLSTMTMMGDYWFCQNCCDEWKKDFDACDHLWEPQESEFGEPGRYCGKCCGFTLLDVKS
jgi:hypothetical protein